MVPREVGGLEQFLSLYMVALPLYWIVCVNLSILNNIRTVSVHEPRWTRFKSSLTTTNADSTPQPKLTIQTVFVTIWRLQHSRLIIRLAHMNQHFLGSLKNLTTICIIEYKSSSVRKVAAKPIFCKGKTSSTCLLSDSNTVKMTS